MDTSADQGSADESLQGEGSASAEDKQKVSRWQIGSGSLGVLEQVYQMEPFPGLDTRRELSRKLNVSARQVQVWFQNKRQRERKLSRAKGLLSTPGLPDTPAVAAAAAAARAAATTGVECAPAAAEGVSAAPEDTAFTSATPSEKEGEATAQSPASIPSASVASPQPPPQQPPPQPPPQPQPPHPQTQQHFQTPLPMSEAPRPLAGLPLGRSTSLPNANEDALSLALGANRSTSGLPLSNGRSSGFGARVREDAESSLTRTHKAAKGQGGTHIPRTHTMPEKSLNDFQRYPPRHEEGLRATQFGAASRLPPCNELIGAVPWMHAPRMPASTQQAQMHCRAAVAAAAAAMSGGAPSLPGLGVRGLPMLQSLLPHGASAASSMRHPDMCLAGLHHPHLSSPLGAFDSGLDHDIESLDDLAAIDLPSELERDLFETSTPIPDVTATPSTRQVIGRPGGQCAPQPTGGDDSSGGGDSYSQAPSKSFSVEALPMARSGCSGLLDSMSLGFASGGKSGADSVISDDASMETVLFNEQEAQSTPQPQAQHAASLNQRCAEDKYQAEPSDMTCDADRYVQVITSGEEPFQIVWASEAWLQLCEFTMGQVLGQTLDLIQGPLTTRTSLNQLMNSIRHGHAVSLSMVNHTRTGKAFSHTLRVEPLRDSQGKVQCFQATSSNIDFLGADLQSSMLVKAAASYPPAAAAAASNSNSNSAPLSDVTTPLTASPLFNEDGRFPSPEHDEAKNLKRVSSDIQISEMLDLFDSSRCGMPSHAEGVLLDGTPDWL